MNSVKYIAVSSMILNAISVLLNIPLAFIIDDGVINLILGIISLGFFIVSYITYKES